MRITIKKCAFQAAAVNTQFLRYRRGASGDCRILAAARVSSRCRRPSGTGAAPMVHGGRHDIGERA
jgi:hypothetical protein